MYDDFRNYILFCPAVCISNWRQNVRLQHSVDVELHLITALDHGEPGLLKQDWLVYQEQC